MSVLQIIRHAQASFLTDHYDLLSPLGEEQSRVMGEHWADSGRKLDRVFVGPLRRHHQTMEAVADVYRSRGLDWPEPEELAGLAEHRGQALVNRTLPRWIEERPDLADLAELEPAKLRRYFAVFREITLLWARGELETPSDLEPWADFRARVTRGLERILDATGHGEDVVVFTSGGPVGVAAGMALELPDEKVLALSWRVRNTAHAELLYAGEGLTLDTFNASPHIREPRLVTHI